MPMKVWVLTKAGKYADGFGWVTERQFLLEPHRCTMPSRTKALELKAMYDDDDKKVLHGGEPKMVEIIVREIHPKKGHSNG